MKELSKKKKLKTQLEILPAGGTDTAGIQRMNPRRLYCWGGFYTNKTHYTNPLKWYIKRM